MSEILDQLFKANKRIDKVNDKLKEIGRILIYPEKDLESITTKDSKISFNNYLELTTIYQNNDLTITYGIWKKANSMMPEHFHKDSVEHLICTKGSVSVNYLGNIYILKKGECLTIEKGTPHSVTALEDNTMIFAICVPPEKVYLVKE